VNDTQDKIDAIRALVDDLDRAIRQVQIESRIVIARSDFSHELGVRFGVSTVRTSSSSDNILVVGATGSGVDTTFFSLGDDDPDSILLPTQPGRYNVNLPVSNPAGSFALSFLNGDYLLDLELSALESEGQGEVISSPRVITANQAEAFIQQGVEIPYQQSTSSGATNVQFKEAVLELRVTPLITPDNRVQLELSVKQDTVGDVFVLQNGAQIPAIDTRELSTSVLVNNGETVVLGGIYQDESNYTETKVPGLGDLPGIGSLFRNKNTKTEKRELLIFVTPTILDDRISVY
jgi:type IV pilus assembly protein PilQ